MAGSGEAKSSAEEVISQGFSTEFATCGKRIKNRDATQVFFSIGFPVGVGENTLHMVNTSSSILSCHFRFFGETSFLRNY